MPTSRTSPEAYGTNACLVGMTTHSGTVTAATDWGGPAERKLVRPSLVGSYERLFHDAAPAKPGPDFLLRLRDGGDAAEHLRTPRMERAIGVIYRPETERFSHYFHASLAEQFDALIHFDETFAVEPLERSVGWEQGEAPETYPFGV